LTVNDLCPRGDWAALTVREHVGARIKALAGSQGLAVSDYLEEFMAGGVS
jgi:hypothetical protein